MVVTGYGDFGETYSAERGRPNPSGLLAHALARTRKGVILESRQLCVTHAAVEGFIADMQRDPPDLILGLGVSPRGQVEESPENWKREAIDGEGQPITAGSINAQRPPHERLRSLLPTAFLEAALTEGVADGRLTQRTLATSADETYAPDASGYLCNYLNYRLTESFGPGAEVMAGFIHVTDATAVDELEIVLDALVRNLHQDEPAMREVG